eukprot:COSAG02_NODE_5226_length_4525_cov_2103.337551_2_plen_310_part_01
MAPESRSHVEQAAETGFKSNMNVASTVFTEADVRKLYVDSMQSGIMRHEDLSLACGWGWTMFIPGYAHPSSLTAANNAGVFSSALALYRRVEPSPLPASWWEETCCLIDFASARAFALSTFFACVKRLPAAPQSAIQSSWWSDLLDHALRLAKLNASAGLSERSTMASVPILQAISIVELAAQDESQHRILLGSGVADALEYAMLHDFTYMGVSITAYASGAAVTLFGTNEGGKVLSSEAVYAVLDRVHAFFRSGEIFSTSPASSILGHFSRVTIMTISDANKKHMLQFQPLIEMLLECLVIDNGNRRKG